MKIIQKKCYRINHRINHIALGGGKRPLGTLSVGARRRSIATTTATAKQQQKHNNGTATTPRNSSGTTTAMAQQQQRNKNRSGDWKKKDGSAGRSVGDFTNEDGYWKCSLTAGCTTAKATTRTSHPLTARDSVAI